MKHSLLKHGFVSKWCYIHWSQLIVLQYYNFSLLWHRKSFQWNHVPVGTTEVCSGDLWFLCSTSSLHGPPPPTLQSSLPSQARLLHPGIPAQQISSIYISKKHSHLYRAKVWLESGNDCYHHCFSVMEISPAAVFWIIVQPWPWPLLAYLTLYGQFLFACWSSWKEVWPRLPPLSLCQTLGRGPWSGIWSCLVCPQRPWSLAVSPHQACKSTLSVMIYAHIHPHRNWAVYKNHRLVHLYVALLMSESSCVSSVCSSNPTGNLLRNHAHYSEGTNKSAVI